MNAAMEGISFDLVAGKVGVDGVHEYDEWSTDAEKHWHECTVCNTKLDEAAHDFEWTVVTESTEEEKGLEKGVCSVCKYETERELPLKDHEHKYGDEWLKDSENHWHECKCGEKGEVAAHTWDEGKVTKEEADCKTPGEKLYTCTVCGETKTEEIKTDDAHKYGEWEKADDKNHKRTCEVCGEDETEEHAFEWAVVTEATEEAEGLEKGTCSVCKFETERTIDKKPHVHNMTAVAGKPATCVAAGICDYWHCNKCDKNYSDKDGKSELSSVVLPVSPNNHLFNGNICVNCGYTRPVFNNMSGAPVYLNESLHGVYVNGRMMPMPHTEDLLGVRTDGVTTWKVCGVCGHVYGETAVTADGETDDAVQVIDVDTPTEGGNNGEDVEGDTTTVNDNEPAAKPEKNPTTGVAVSVIPMVLAALAIAVKKH